MPKVKTTKQKEKSDAEKQIEDWRRLTVEVLRLKCENYNLAITGRKQELVNRLYQHFNNQENVDPINGGGNELPQVKVKKMNRNTQ